MFPRFKDPISHEACLEKLELDIIYMVHPLGSHLGRVVTYLMPEGSHASRGTENHVRTRTVLTFKAGPKNNCCHYLGFGKSQYQGQRTSVQGFETESEYGSVNN